MLEHLFVVRTADKAASARSSAFHELDVQLSELGHAQALDLAAWIKAHPVQAVFASPMFRTLQTADAVANILGIPLRLEDGLMPWNPLVPADAEPHPDHAPVEVLRRSFFSLGQCGKSLGKAPSRSGESLEELAERIETGLEALIRHCDQTGIKSAMLVTHAAPAIVISSLLGHHGELVDEEFETGGCRSFSRSLERGGEGERNILGWQFAGRPPYLQAMFDHRSPWSFGRGALVPDTSVPESDGATQLSYALMQQHSPLFRFHAKRPSNGRTQTH